MTSDDREERLASILALALEAKEAGTEPDLGLLCAADPSLIDDVAKLLAMTPNIARLHRASIDREVSCDRSLTDRYRLVERIGSGAAGTVYRALDTELRREVAVKLLHQGALGGSAAEERFLREAEVLANHEHEAIVRVYDRGRTDRGELFLVTELLHGIGMAELLELSRATLRDGPSARAFADVTWLQERMPRARLESSYLRQILRWMVQLCDGLAHTHDDGVFHRDVKPSNVFVRDDGRAVLLDFGLAARVGDPALTLQTSVLGTPWYMAPEQARGRTEPSPTLDVYGVTATLYHLCTFRAPHGLPDDHAPLAEVLRAARERDPEPATRLHPGLPRDLAAILDHGLESDPTRRYRSVRELADDLRAFLDHRPVTARPIRALGRVWRRVRRRPTSAIAVFGIAASILLAAVVLPLSQRVTATARAEERSQILATLPADLSIEGWPDQRLLVPLTERTHALENLDRLLELDPGDLSIRLLRASEALDAGDHDRASADLREIARAASDPYVRAVAERYASCDDSRAGIAAVALSDLPEPDSAAGHFIAGFHALRTRQIELSITHLDRAEDFVPARDLRLLAILGARQWDRAMAEAHWLEGHYGRPTARTRHTLAAASLGRRHYAEAIDHAKEALALRPDRHGPWNNLGFANLRLGRLQDARMCFERAVAIRPWFDNSRAGLCQVLRTMEDFEDAEREARAIRAPWWREWELGNVGVARALLDLRTGQATSADAHAESAIEHFQRVAADTDPANQKRLAADAAIAFARSLMGKPTAEATIRLLTAMRAEPLNPAHLLNLCELLGTVDPRDSTFDALQLWLLEVGREIAPDDPRWTALRTSLRDRTAERNR